MKNPEPRRPVLRRIAQSLPRPRIRSRTALILIPVHLVAFFVLYLGMKRVVQHEMLNTHSNSARVMLSEAVHTLHPLMCTSNHAVIPTSVADFAKAHSMLDLRIYRSDGSLMGQPGKPYPDIIDFMAGSTAERFNFVDRGDITALQGVKKINSEGSCVECHERGKLLGAATMDLDLTPEVSAAHERLGRNVVFLVGGWILAVGAVNIGIGRWTRRSLAHIRQLESDVSTHPGGGIAPPMPGALLDPVAAELYRSLAKVLRRQQENQEAVSDRLHHTERLASLGQLAAGLAHEIKNPLAGIRGVMELMRDDTDSETQKELFEQVVGELDRVNETIHLLLHFARPSPAKRETTDVRALLEDSVQLLRPSLAKQNITLSVDIADGVGTFALDSNQMRQVITNLVTNAGDAIESGGKIVLRASPFPEGDGLIISVQDDGPGIPADDLDRVFDPFFTTKFSGTGLGLPVIRSQIAQHQGRIEVESEVGVGTTFFIILPAAGSDDESATDAFNTRGA